MKRVFFILLLCAMVFCFAGGAYGNVTETQWDCNYDVYVATVDGGVNLREAPSTDASILCLIPDFKLLHITKESSAGNGWGYCSYNGMSGWVALSQVTKSSPITQTSYIVYVSAGDGVNLRSGPYTSYSLIENIPYGTELEVDATYNGWGEVFYQGNFGWIALSQVTTEELQIEETVKEEPVPIAEEPTDNEPVVNSSPDNGNNAKQDNNGNFMTILLIGFIILVVLVAVALIFGIIIKRK